jgi:hypothetical protein
VLVVNVRIVRMGVRQRLVAVLVGVRLAPVPLERVSVLVMEMAVTAGYFEPA